MSSTNKQSKKLSKKIGALRVEVVKLFTHVALFDYDVNRVDADMAKAESTHKYIMAYMLNESLPKPARWDTYPYNQDWSNYISEQIDKIENED